MILRLIEALNILQLDLSLHFMVTFSGKVLSNVQNFRGYCSPMTKFLKKNLFFIGFF